MTQLRSLRNIWPGLKNDGENILVRRLTGASLGVAGLVLLATVVSAGAESAQHRVNVRIDSVLAADTNQGCDKRLHSLSQRLRRMFHYSTFRLVKHEESRTPFGQTAAFSLPGGFILHVEPTGMDGNMIKSEMMLFGGSVPIMITEFKLMNHGTIFVGGPRYDTGSLIISIELQAPPGEPGSQEPGNALPIIPAGPPQ